MRNTIRLALAVKLVFCLIILITSCSDEPRYYIAFGDSVSSGYGLASPEESHPAIFFSLLKQEGYVDNFVNMAVCGFTTSMLLDLLNNMDDSNLQVIRNAHIITLNIGGNNLLAPFSYYWSNLRVVSGIDNIILGTGGIIAGTLDIISGVRTGIENIISDLEENRPPAPIVISGVGDVIAGAGTIITGAGEIISGSTDVFSILFGSFSPELSDKLEKGLQTFSDEFKEIISWIQRRAPNATIIVNTVYNPIPPEVLRASLAISIAANVLVESMNSIIIQESKARGYLVTDIYTHFSNQLNMMQFNINPSAGSLSFDIIHPNADGHNLIAQLNYETLKQR